MKVGRTGMRWIGCLIVCLLCGAAYGATLQVSPVRISISADGKAAVVRLHNQSDVPTLIQVEALMWNEADLTNAPRTPEILAVPPVFEIGAGAEQVIRLALRRPMTSDTEQAYRLLITEVPRAVGDGEEGISFALRLNLPVFVTPKGALPQPAWSLAGGELKLGNRGNAHVRVRNFALFVDGDEDPVFTSNDGGYVLAGGERSWQLDLGRVKTGAALTIKAETNLGDLESVVEVGG
ncbi:MAG: molecular chaperone [Pseudomonadota bacterium]